MFRCRHHHEGDKGQGGHGVKRRTDSQLPRTVIEVFDGAKTDVVDDESGDKK